MYRGGVSEGQFIKVLQFELLAVRQACMDLKQVYRPGITFVVQKQDQSRRAGNICLWDFNIGADELQNLTYQLCHTYTKCNRSVCILNYYAHLVLIWARYLIINMGSQCR